MCVLTGPAVLSPPASNECESLACSWLQSQYEVQRQSDCKLSRMDMYRRYVSMSGARGLQNIVTPAGFAACIKYVPLIQNIVTPAGFAACIKYVPLI